MGFTCTFKKNVQNKTIPSNVLMCYNLQSISRERCLAEVSISVLFQLRFDNEKDLCLVPRQLIGQGGHSRTSLSKPVPSKAT